MPFVEFDKDDLMQGVLVDPDWYRVRCDSVGEKPTVTEKGPSVNYPCTGVVLFNANNGSTKYKGVRVFWQFNSKMKGSIRVALEAIGENVEEGRYDIGALANKEFDVYITRGEWKGRFRNQIDNMFRPPRPDVHEQ